MAAPGAGLSPSDRESLMYGTVDVVFWRDDKMRAASEDARHLMLYLLTSPHRNRLGVFVLDPWYATADVQWTLDRFVRARDELVEIGRIEWHDEEAVVVLVNWWKRNVLQNPAAALGGVKELADVPDGPFLAWLQGELETWGRAHYRPLVAAVDNRVEKWRGAVAGAGRKGPLSAQPRGNSVNDPAISRASRSVPNRSVPSRAEQPESTDQATNGGGPDDPPPDGGGRRSESRDADQATIDALPSPAQDALRGLRHPQGRWATARAIRTRFLYADGDDGLAHEAVRGMPLGERLRLVAGALVEMATQRDTFKPATLAVFIGTLRRSPKPGTEAARVSRTDARKRYTAPARPEGDLVRVDYLALLHDAGVSPPGGSTDDAPPPNDARSA